MKRVLVFIVLMYLSVNQLHAQTWPKIYTGMSAWAFWSVQSYDKGYVIVGTKKNYRMGWVIKTDINGNKLWDKKIANGYYPLFPSNIEQTQDNGFIIGGTTNQIGNQADAFILKLNSCADLEWCKIIHTPNLPNDQGFCVKPSSDGGYVLLGFGNDLNPLNRINLFHFDGSGNLSWHYSYPPDSLVFNEDAYNIYVDTDGFLLTGAGYYPDPSGPPGYGSIRPYFLKTDTNGLTSWITVYGKGTYYWGRADKVVKGISNNYYCASRHSDTTGFDYPAMTKLFHNGDTAYSTNLIQNSILGIATTINMMDDTTLIIGIGWSPDNIIGNIGLIKTDTLGHVRQSITFLNDSYYTLSATVKSFDNKYFSVANNSAASNYIYAWKVNSNLEYDTIYNQPFVYDSLCPHPIVSDTLSMNCDLIVDVEEPFDKPETTHLKVFPNPATDHITVELPKYLELKSGLPNFQSTTIYHHWNFTTIEVYNLNGEKVFQKEIPMNQTQLELDAAFWPKGLYLFRLVFNKLTVASEKVVLK